MRTPPILRSVGKMDQTNLKLKNLVALSSSMGEDFRQAESVFLEENPWIIPLVERIKVRFLEQQSLFGERQERSLLKLKADIFWLMSHHHAAKDIWSWMYVQRLWGSDLELIQDANTLRISIEQRLTELFQSHYAVDYQGLVEEIMGAFRNKPRYREALARYYGLCGYEPTKSYAELGRQMGLSGSRAREYIQYALRRLRHPKMTNVYKLKPK